ncbi:MAG: hypothetical protein ACOYL3_07195 [Desulfuromonadaceae bacterium]
MISSVWVAFWIGAYIGGIAGVLLIALCMAAKSGDERMPEQDSLCRACRKFLEEP